MIKDPEPDKAGFHLRRGEEALTAAARMHRRILAMETPVTPRDFGKRANAEDEFRRHIMLSNAHFQAAEAWSLQPEVRVVEAGDGLQ